MTPFLAALEHQLREAAEREVTARRRPSPFAGRRRLRSLIHSAPVIVAVGVGVAVFVLGIVVLHPGRSHTASPGSTVPTPTGAVMPVGAPAGPAHPLKEAASGRVQQGTVKLAAEGRDLRGGLPWGLETFRMADGETCVLAGREQGGRVGVIGQDGSFHDDGRFHPYTPFLPSAYCGQTDGRGNAFLTVAAWTAPASGNDQGAVVGGCQASAAGGRANRCPKADERQLEYGLLGPDARSVTYITGGHRVTVPTGPGGAFIVVGSPDRARSAGAVSDRLIPGLVTAVRYRDGSTCRPGRVRSARHVPLGCPPVGYVAPPHARVTTAEVQAPVTAEVITATRWCGSHSGYVVPCDGRVPAGYRVIPGSAGMKLLQWSWIARVAASGSNAGYEYAIKGSSCGGGQSSSGPIPARRGQRIVQQSLGSTGCAQQDTISVEYRTNVGPGGPNFASPPNPGHDGEPLVGSTTISVPR